MTLPTTEQWIMYLDPSLSWKHCYPTVTEAARPILAALPSGRIIDTDELVRRLMPDYEPTERSIKARSRVYKALDAGSKHNLADCSFREPGKSWGKDAMLKRWRAPDPNFRKPSVAAPVTIPATATPDERYLILLQRVNDLEQRLDAREAEAA